MRNTPFDIASCPDFKLLAHRMLTVEKLCQEETDVRDHLTDFPHRYCHHVRGHKSLSNVHRGICVLLRSDCVASNEGYPKYSFSREIYGGPRTVRRVILYPTEVDSCNCRYAAEKFV
jgi:hypothetical protein